MKNLFLLVISIFISISVVNAQKLEEGSLNFLKNVDNLHFQFDYSQMKIKKQTEAEFVAEKVNELNKEESGKGDEWKKNWETSYRNEFEELFIKDFNTEISGNKLKGGIFSDSEYVATVYIIGLDPGFFGGPMSKPAIITADVIFTKKNSSEILAKVSMKNVKGGMYDFADKFGGEVQRIRGAFGEVGEELGGFVAKALKKK